jgi:photosystem II stability/assembly factor-like uncharacterized protein
MKKIFTILIASVLLSIPLKAQWQQTLTGQSSLLDAVCVVNDSVIWIKDQMGDKFSITKDAGKTWTTKSFPVGLASNRICGSLSAVSDKIAFVIVSMASATANPGIYKTTDGGDTWVRQATAFNSAASFPDLVYFWNENEGIIVGDGISTANGILEIYTTTNGGTQWNAVPAANMPSSASTDWGINTNSFIRVRGNTVYVMAGSGWIYKSANKGLNWTAINTPALNNGSNAKFDFKDDNNGLVSVFNTTTKTSAVYSTTNAGVNWIKVDSTSAIREIKYVPTLNTYFGTSLTGLAYSTNNGISWTKHPSFLNVGLQPLSVTPSGSIYVGGWSYVYNTSNYTGVNLSVTKSKLTGSKSIDMTFSTNVDLTSAQDTANYLVNYRLNNVATYTKIPLLSATVDATNKALIHLVTTVDLPIDTCFINVINVKGTNNISVINKSASAYSSIIRTSLTDYSSVKYGLIGSSYFLNNTSNGTKAQWNICWKDVVNNIQASVPAISGGGKIFTWSFPAVYLFGGISSGDGMFKFCLVNTDNTPNWGAEPIGYPQTNAYTGSAVADVDKTTDGGGAFTILTSGLVKKYNLQLIIDQTSGIDQITLDINGVTTATNSIIRKDEVIVGYRIYNESGKLITTVDSPAGLNLQNIKSTLHKGVYLMNAKLSTGQYYNFKFVVQ